MVGIVLGRGIGDSDGSIRACGGSSSDALGEGAMTVSEPKIR